MAWLGAADLRRVGTNPLCRTNLLCLASINASVHTGFANPLGQQHAWLRSAWQAWQVSLASPGFSGTNQQGEVTSRPRRRRHEVYCCKVG